MFKLFRRLIKGDLRPHLIDENDLTIVKDLLKTTLKIDKDSHAITTDSEYINLGFAEGCEVEIILNEENEEENKLIIKEDKNLEPLINLYIPPAPDTKSKKYQQLIERETKIIKAKLLKFLEECNDMQKLELFARKNYQILLDLADNLRLYTKKLPGEHGNDFTDKADHFVAHLLREELISLMEYMQFIFPQYLVHESRSVIKRKYFDIHYPSASYLTAHSNLIKMAEYSDFLEKLREKFSTKRNIPVGEFLFNFFKEKHKDLNHGDKITKFTEILHYWQQLLIANKLTVVIDDYVVNDPEFEKILIPLLENEIDFLTKSVSTKTEIRGFNSNFSEQVLINVHKKMTDNGFIKSDVSDFLSIFSDNVIKNTKPIVWAIKYRGKGHKSALRDFLELIVGEINFDSLENKRRIETLFTDGKKGMMLNKKKDPSSHYMTFKKIIKSSQ